MRTLLTAILLVHLSIPGISQPGVYKNKLTAPIDKGSLYGNNGLWSMEFIDKKFTLHSGETFSLREKGLLASSTYTPIGLDLEKDMKNLKKFKKGYPIYRVKINYKDKMYYGLMIFFNAQQKKVNETVCRSYEVAISDKSLAAADKGGIGRNYEYYWTRLLTPWPIWIVAAPAFFITYPIIAFLKTMQPTYLIHISTSEEIYDMVNPNLIVR